MVAAIMKMRTVGLLTVAHAYIPETEGTGVKMLLIDGDDFLEATEEAE